MTTATIERKLKPYSQPLGSDFMRRLIVSLPPRPITSRALHHSYREALSVLMDALDSGDVRGQAKEDLSEYVNVIAGLLEDYERKAFPLKRATPGEVLAFLMDQHSLTQVDLAGDLGGQPVVSDVLRGKRQLTREHIERLSERFHVSPAVFFPTVAK